MKKLLLTPVLAILTGCVSYYYPYGEPVEGVQYVPAEEYVENVYYEDEVVDGYDYSDIYVSSPHYPWWSIDYFYLGSHHRHNGFSVGVSYGSPYSLGGYGGYYDPFYPSYGYSPWEYRYSPYIYSSWYSPFYDRPSRYFGGYSYYWRNRYDRHNRSRHHDRDRRQDRGRHADNRRGRHGSGQSTLRPGHNDRLRDEDRYAGDNRDRNDRRRRGEDGPGGEGRNPRQGGPGTAGLRRHTTVAGGTAAGERGMEVRSKTDRKRKASRMEPVTRKPVVKLSPSDGIRVAPRGKTGVVSSANDKGKVRSPRNGKDIYSGRTPVKSRPGSYRPDKSTTGSRAIVSSKKGTQTVRAPARRKTQPTRPQPSRPSVSNSAQHSPVVTYRPPKTNQANRKANNSRKPIATINSKPSRPAPVTRTKPVQPATGRAQSRPAARPQFRQPAKTAPARQQKSTPRYSTPAQRPAKPPPRAARPAQRPSAPARSRPAPRNESKGDSEQASRRGSNRGSKRK